MYKSKTSGITIKIKNNTILLSFKDNGGGVPDDIINKILEPYFTTKHQSQGTGLGLSMVYSIIIERMNGSLEAINSTYTYNNQQQKGLEFKFTIPIS